MKPRPRKATEVSFAEMLRTTGNAAVHDAYKHSPDEVFVWRVDGRLILQWIWHDGEEQLREWTLGGWMLLRGLTL